MVFFFADFRALRTEFATEIHLNSLQDFFNLPPPPVLGVVENNGINREGGFENTRISP